MSNVALDPLWLEGPAGPLFAVMFRPPEPDRGTRGFLVVPPFGEELNKSRRMMAMVARAIASKGSVAIIVDLFGTGDSQGDFSDARFEIWTEDLRVAMSVLHRVGVQEIDVLAIRAGSLLLTSTLMPTSIAVGRLALWHPVANGRQFVQQLFRLRSAGSIASGNAAETISSMRSLLVESGSLEIAGYTVPIELVNALDRCSLTEGLPPVFREIGWFEVGSEDRSDVAPASARIVAAIMGKGGAVQHRTIAGEPFWGTPEIGVIPKLITSTVQFLQGGTL